MPDTQANPYRPPAGVDDQSAKKDRTIIGVVCFWSAVAFTLMGCLSVFLRNVPPLGWFLIATLLFVAAIWFSANRYRVAAVTGLLLCLLIVAAVTMLHYRRLQTALDQERRLKAYEAQMAMDEAQMGIKMDAPPSP